MLVEDMYISVHSLTCTCTVNSTLCKYAHGSRSLMVYLIIICSVI